MGRVQRLVTSLARESGLATEFEKGNLSITRVTRTLESLDRDAVFREVERRTAERTILSRGNHTCLAPT